MKSKAARVFQSEAEYREWLQRATDEEVKEDTARALAQISLGRGKALAGDERRRGA